MPPRIPPEVMSALNPFLTAIAGVVKDTVQRTAEAAVDAALEEVETRVRGDRPPRLDRAPAHREEAPATVGWSRRTCWCGHRGRARGEASAQTTSAFMRTWRRTTARGTHSPS